MMKRIESPTDKLFKNAPEDIRKLREEATKANRAKARAEWWKTNGGHKNV